MTYRLSIAERIALTSGFNTSSDSRVLTALASFAHFETGVGARPTWARLQARVPDLSRRTVARCLARLEDEGWIEGHHYSRRPTVYRICVERLATSATIAKVVVSNPVVECQSGTTSEEIGSATLSIGSATLSIGSAKVAPDLDLDLDLDPRSTGAGAPGLFEAVENENPGGESAHDLPRLPTALRDRPAVDHRTPDGVGLGPEGSDQATARAVGVSLRPPADSARDGCGRASDAPTGSDPGRAPHGPDAVTTAAGVSTGSPVETLRPRTVAVDERQRPRDGPLWQPTLGPLDVTAVDPETRKQSHLQRLKQILTDALSHTTGPQARERERDKRRQQG